MPIILGGSGRDFKSNCHRNTGHCCYWSEVQKNLDVQTRIEG